MLNFLELLNPIRLQYFHIGKQKTLSPRDHGWVPERFRISSHRGRFPMV